MDCIQLLIVGKSGCGVYKYKLLRITEQSKMGSALLKFSANLRVNPLLVRLFGYLSLDISQGNEKLPIFLYNDIAFDQELMLFKYLVKLVYPPFCISANW